jgi:hypothetical protein
MRIGNTPFFDRIYKFNIRRIEIAFPLKPDIKIGVKRMRIHIQIIQIIEKYARSHYMGLLRLEKGGKKQRSKK